MTKDEERAIRNVIARLKEPNCGGAAPEGAKVAPGDRFEPVSRVYLESWVIPALELILPGPERNPRLAVRLSSR